MVTFLMAAFPIHWALSRDHFSSEYWSPPTTATISFPPSAAGCRWYNRGRCARAVVARGRLGRPAGALGPVSAALGPEQGERGRVAVRCVLGWTTFGGGRDR